MRSEANFTGVIFSFSAFLVGSNLLPQTSIRKAPTFHIFFRR